MMYFFFEIVGRLQSSSALLRDMYSTLKCVVAGIRYDVDILLFFIGCI